jgi:hypothetical protein
MVLFKLIIVFIILAVCAAIGALLWPYTLNTWLVFFDKAPAITALHGALLGFCPFIGQATIPAAVVTWVLMLFIGK